jgi:hypothetical protein
VTGSSGRSSAHARPVADSRAGPRSRPAVPLVALLTLLLAALVTVGPPMLRPARWTATVTTQLQPAAGSETATPYVYDVLSRPVVVATYAAILADPRFVREAGDRLGLQQPERGQARVQVGQVPRSAVFEVTVTSPRRTDAVALAPGLTEAAAAYVQRLDSLYALAPAAAVAGSPPSASGSAGYPVEVRQLPRYGPSISVVLVASLLPAWIVAWLLLVTWSALRPIPGPGRHRLATLR